MTIDIQEICSRWNISRPTVMKAISERKLIGEKDRQGKWGFETSNVVMWRGEPGDVPMPPTAAKATETTPMLLLMRTMEEYISTLKSQLDVKDRQLSESQETMREQMRLLTYAGPALSKTTDEVGELKQQLAEKDQQMAKLEKVMVEKVALLMKKQQQVEKERVARPKVVTAADQLED